MREIDKQTKVGRRSFLQASAAAGPAVAVAAVPVLPVAAVVLLSRPALEVGETVVMVFPGVMWGAGLTDRA